MKNFVLATLFIAILAIGGFYLFGQNTSLKKPEIKSESTMVKEFTITAKQWQFDPATITINKGDRVKLKITAADVTHGFSLPDFNVKVDLQPNVETIVKFTADKTGEFTFFCSVICGQGHTGMKGKLIVE